MDYPTFIEMLRKRQVLQGMGNPSSKPLDAFNRKQDWAIPSFDFGRELWPDPARKALYAAYDQWLLDGRFRLPFPDCVFLDEYPDAHLIVRAMEQDDGSVVLQPYTQEKSGGPVRRLAYAIAIGGASAPWTRAPSGTPMSRLLLDVEEGANLDPEHTRTWAVKLTTRSTLAAFVLIMAKPDDECFVFTSPETSALISANRGRAMAGLPPIPATRTLKIRLEALQRVVWRRRGHHSPKSPHVRRGHLRGYKDGMVRWIEAMSIKGGGNPVPKKVILLD